MGPKGKHQEPGQFQIDSKMGDTRGLEEGALAKGVGSAGTNGARIMGKMFMSRPPREGEYLERNLRSCKEPRNVELGGATDKQKSPVETR